MNGHLIFIEDPKNNKLTDEVQASLSPHFTISTSSNLKQAFQMAHDQSVDGVLIADPSQFETRRIQGIDLREFCCPIFSIFDKPINSSKIGNLVQMIDTRQLSPTYLFSQMHLYECKLARNLFAARAAHDLLNPVGQISGLVEMIKDCEKKDSILFEQVEKSILTLTQIIGDLANLAETDDDLTITEIDLNSMIKQITQRLEDRMVVESSGDFSNFDGPADVIGDIIETLVTCWAQLSTQTDEPRISITGYLDEKYNVISITNRQITVRPCVLKRMALPFFKHDANSTESGLNLFRGQTLIDSLGGYLSIKRPSKDTIMLILYLPIEDFIDSSVEKLAA